MRDEKTEPRPAWVPLALTSARVTLALVRTTPRSTHPSSEKRPGHKQRSNFRLVGGALDVRAHRQPLSKKDTRAALRRVCDVPLPGF